MDRAQLLTDLQSFGSESDAAAVALADRGDHAAIPAILGSIFRDCSLEIIPDQKIAAFVRLADVEAVPLVIAQLESLDEAELEHDAGDMIDEFWRIQTACKRMLVRMGQRVVEPVREALAKTGNRFTRECLEAVLTELGHAPR